MSAAVSAKAQPADWRDFLALTKPRVMSLVVFTGLCGLLAAPGSIHPVLGFTAILCIALGAGGAATLNQWWEADIDAKMKRTMKRPLPDGRLRRDDARDFGIVLSVGSVVILGLAIHWLAAVILTISILYYTIVYTIWLKPRTPQNIVIGGGAGAFPPVIGWVAVTGEITLMPVLLFAIIFVWTPPHFWALALYVKTDYAKAGIPMMPVVAGEKSTRWQVLAYSVALFAVSLAPWWIGGAGAIYGVCAAILSAAFVGMAVPVAFRKADDGAAGSGAAGSGRGETRNMSMEKRLFAFSIIYLFVLFAALVVDRVILL